MRILISLFLSISLIGLSLSSCRKDAAAEDLVIIIDSTDYRYELIGNWNFKSTNQDDQWIYEFDSTGNSSAVHYQTFSTNWEYETGTVSASQKSDQIKVKFSDNHDEMLMQVNSNGSISCVETCDDYGFYNDPQYGGGPQGCWHIDSTYCQYIGGPNLPGHVTTTTISGFKIK